MSVVVTLGSATLKLQKASQLLHLNTLCKSSEEAPDVTGQHLPKASSCCDKFSNIGKLIALAGEKVNGAITCLLMSGPENIENVESSAMANNHLLKCSFQWPYGDKTETVSLVFTLGVKMTSFLIDPSLLEMLNYCPRKVCLSGDYEIFLKKKVSEVKIAPRTRTSGSGSESATTRLESSTPTMSDVKTSRGASATPQQLDDDPSQKAGFWKDNFLRWCPALQRLVLQVEIHACTVFLAGSPLAVRCETALSNAVHRSYLTRNERPGLADTTVITFPHVTLSNAASKIQIVNLISDVPIKLPSEFDVQGRVTRNILLLFFFVQHTKYLEKFGLESLSKIHWY